MSEKDLSITKDKNIMLKIIIADIEKINKSLDKIFNDLSPESQELIEEIKTDADKLNHIFKEEFNNQSEKEIFNQLQKHLTELQPQLKQLPYSKKEYIDNLCKTINKLLEKLADFFLNGPIVSEGVYIPIPAAKPHNFNLFRSKKSPNRLVDNLSEKLSDFSQSPSK